MTAESLKTDERDLGGGSAVWPASFTAFRREEAQIVEDFDVAIVMATPEGAPRHLQNLLRERGPLGPSGEREKKT